MYKNTIADNNHTRLEKIREDITTITRIIDQYMVDNTYLKDPANKIEIAYMSEFVKCIDIPYLLENSDITHTLDPIILALYYREESNPTQHNMKRIEQGLHDSKTKTNKILYN